MQKKNPLYSMLKEETVWSMERFNSYINEKFMVPKGLPRDWVLSVFTVCFSYIWVLVKFGVFFELSNLCHHVLGD